MDRADIDRVRELIHLTGRRLDDEDYAGYAALYSERGQYRLQAALPELGKTATWALLGRADVVALLEAADRHVWNTGTRTHLVTVELVQAHAEGATARSTFCVFHTGEAGTTRVYAVGRYEDVWCREGGDWRLLHRVAQLATRELTPPSAVPL